MKTGFLILLVLYANCTFAQNQFKWSALVGTYQFYNDDTTLRYFIKLDSNKIYDFSIANDLIENESTGKWELFGDTLVLTSKYQIDNIGITVTENTGLGNGVEFDGITNIKGQLLPALIYINGDTSKLCDPLAGDCKFARGSIRSFNIVYGKTTSATYWVKNQEASKFSLMLDVDSYLDTYLFMKQRKFLVRNNSIYSLRNNKIDSVILNSNALVPIALIRQ